MDAPTEEDYNDGSAHHCDYCYDLTWGMDINSHRHEDPKTGYDTPGGMVERTVYLCQTCDANEEWKSIETWPLSEDDYELWKDEGE